MCGWVNPPVERVCTLSAKPIWTFHGARDTIVPIAATEFIVSALQSCQSDVKFTVYPELNHDSWTVTYNNSELYSWFLKHTL